MYLIKLTLLEPGIIDCNSSATYCSRTVARAQGGRRTHSGRSSDPTQTVHSAENAKFKYTLRVL